MPSILSHIKLRYSAEMSRAPDVGTRESDNTVRDIPLPLASTAVSRSDRHDDSGPSADSTGSGDMRLTCRGCGKTAKLTPYEGDTSMTSPDTGAWYQYACACGHAAYICERDYYRVHRQRVRPPT